MDVAHFQTDNKVYMY